MNNYFKFHFFTIFLFLSASLQSHGIESCQRIGDLSLQSIDEPCRAVSDAAKACFTKINAEMFSLKESKEDYVKEDFNREKQLIINRYKSEIEEIDRRFIPTIKTYGKGCSFQHGQLEAYWEAMKEDLKTIQELKFD